MVTKAEYKEIPGFSRLFNDFILKESFFEERFPTNKMLFESSNTELKKRAETFQERGEAVKAIMTSMEKLHLSVEQNQNLELLRERNSLTVITGQQVGFLCSPLYILLKIFSCINLSRKLNNIHSELRFIPVFWIEDNDHDNLEASQADVFGEKYNPVHLSCCPECTKTDRTSVSDKVFGSKILDTLNYLEQVLPNAQFKTEIISHLKRIYKPGKSWSSAYLELLQNWLSETGILFVRSSILRETGLYSDLAERELQMPGGSDRVINKTNEVIEAQHYHIQAKTSDINLFMHINGKRHKIQKNSKPETFLIANREYSIKDLLNTVRAEPEAFSPNVLLRPVFQEVIFPNAAYIAGPSEIGYATQLKEVYQHFSIQMPAFIPRHSATFIDKHTARFLDKYNIQPQYFLRQYQDIEPELRQKLLDENVQYVISSSRSKIIEVFSEISDKASSIDINLKSSTEAALQKTLNHIEALEKKIFSAQKKHHDLLYDKYKSASNLIYPGGSLQERIVSPINFMMEIGIEKFFRLLDDITRQENDRHYFVEL